MTNPYPLGSVPHEEHELREAIRPYSPIIAETGDGNAVCREFDRLLGCGVLRAATPDIKGKGET